MEKHLIVICCLLGALQCTQTVREEQSEDDYGDFADFAAELFQSQGAQGLGSVVQGIMGSALSGVLSGADGGTGGRDLSNLGQVLRGIGNMVGPNAQGIDTEVLSGIFGMIGSSMDPNKKEKGGVDMLSMLSTVGNVLGQPGNAERIEQLSGYMPLIMDFVNSLAGPAAHEREKRHAGHSWLFPPVFERLHVLADHFMSSEFGRRFMESIGAEKIIKIFADESGHFSYDKFVELMENHSFRRHWIHMLTLRMGKFFEHYSDPKIYQQFVGMISFMVNSYLTNQGYPKSIMINAESPLENIPALLDFFSEKYLGAKIESQYYIQPVITYIGQLFEMLREQGRARGGTEGISAKLADSINLEIIEPIARVNRAYRYLKKNPKCDKYVLCLINRKGPETDTIPGLKMILSRATSFVASWALSNFSDGSIMEYFNLILYEDQCEKYFKPECSDYHDEEVKVTTEYIHNEL